MKDKCEWKDGKFVPCVSLKQDLREELEYSIENEMLGFYCKWCGADIRKPEPMIDPEERFKKWWSENLSTQPPVIDLSDSFEMIAKKYSKVGFMGCYHALQEKE